MDGPARREAGDEALFLTLRFNDEKEAKALVDTGASDCFMSKFCKDQIPKECIQDSWTVKKGEISLADNSSQNILEQVRCKFSIQESTVFYDFNVVDNLCHSVVIGRNLLTVLRSDLALPGGKVEVFCGNPITSRETVKIPPGNECLIPVTTLRPLVLDTYIAYCAPAVTASVIVEGCINTVGSEWWIKVMNPLEETQIITPKDVLAFAEECAVPEVNRESIEEFLDLQYISKTDTPISLCRIAVDVVHDATQIGSEIAKGESEVKSDENIDKIDLNDSCLNDEQKVQFRQMLNDNRNALAFSMDELGQCEIAPMKIVVDKSQGIISSRPYRYSPQKMDTIDKEVRQLIEIGVIEPSESAWRSPLVVVQKKDGKPRLCTDFRMLNLITFKDKFPMPTARSLFLYMAYKKPTMWTALDLLSGYHQCVIEPESREYTAFETPMGVYHYKRVPFGLVGAPWQFTKVMAIALKGLIPRVCLAYLDDVIIYDTTFEQHLESVELVLKALAKADLKVKPSKCEWCRSEINFLGHVVNAEGVATQKVTTEKITAFNRPHNVKTVKSFLGLCNYYRPFVPNFADMAKPMNRLLKKEVSFEWSEMCEEAFQQLKKLLTSPPLLIHPDIGGHFHILTDASDAACGAAVCHRMNDIYRPVAFWGCTLKDAELNYTVTEKEALAVIKSIKNYKDMLQGAKITIVTDHKPLIPLLQSAYKAPSSRLRRWALALSDFDFEITYEPGATHFLPDYLSRVHHDHVPGEEFEPAVGCELFEAEIQDGELTVAMIINAQLQDAECVQLMEYVQDGDLPPDPTDARRVMDQADFVGIQEPGVLCRFNLKRFSKNRDQYARIKPRMIIPGKLIPKVLRLLHNDILAGGHVGVSSLTTKISDKFYWRNMNADIVDYVKACETCSLRRRAPHFKALAKSWERPTRPFEVVQCDFIGPLKRAKDGSKYIMTFIDILTGWPEAFATKDSTAQTAANCFLTEIVCRYGRVNRLHTDRGAAFISGLFREITTRLACRQTFTTGRMPTGNARVERLHKTIENLIAYYIPDDHCNWTDLLPIALWTVRSTTSVRSGYSPHTLLFGRDPVSMGMPEQGTIPESLNDCEFFMQIKDNIAMFRNMAERIVTDYERDLRERIDERARPTQMHEGDMVYMYDPLASVNTASKFSNRYTGPYRVIETKGDHLVRLVSLKTGKEIPHLVNICKLKRAHGPWSPALPNTIPKMVRDASVPNSTGADPDQIPESHHTPTGKLTKRDSETRGAKTENSMGHTGAHENGPTSNTEEVPKKNHSESPTALQKTDGQHKTGQGADTHPVSVPSPPLTLANGGQDTAGVNRRGKRKRGRGRGKKQAGAGTAPPATNTTIKQTGGDAHTATTSQEPIQNKQGGSPEGYNLRRTHRPDYAAYFNDAEDDDADM